MENHKSWGIVVIFGILLLFSTNVESLTITSSSFQYNGTISSTQACIYEPYGGANVNPQFTLSDIPSSTKSLALIMDDPDAPGGTYLHWLMYWNNLNIISMNEGSVPAGAVQGVNDSYTMTYFGPCPPSNHRYYFRVYALDTTLSLSSGFTRGQLENAINGHVLESNFLMGWFPSGGKVCTYNLSPQSYEYSNSEATGHIDVICSSSNCTWTASSNYSWITITSGNSGTGNGKVEYSVAKNDTALVRTGTLSIVGQTVTITQAGTPVFQIIPPTVATNTANSITTNSSTLNGTVNPNGASTTYQFQYGKTTSYESVTPAGDAGAGTTNKDVYANLTGLTANTTYHYRLVAWNGEGTTNGSDKTFKTNTLTLPENITSYKVLTDQSDIFIINYGEYVRIFGSSGANTINVKSGGRVQCVNFVGSNVVNRRVA